MTGVGEQLDNRHCGPGAKRHMKRIARKAMRRLGKLLKDDAPKKYYYCGYVS